MKYTTPDGLPLPEPTDDVAPLDELFRDLATAIQAGLAQDTGWKTIAVPSGVTATTYGYRVKRGICYLRGQLSVSPSFANGYTAVGTLPAGARPSVYTRVPIGMYNGYNALLVINGSTGAIQVGASGDRTADSVYVNGVCFPVD